jgi:hypothetical protein
MHADGGFDLVVLDAVGVHRNVLEAVGEGVAQASCEDETNGHGNNELLHFFILQDWVLGLGFQDGTNKNSKNSTFLPFCQVFYTLAYFRLPL